MISWNGFDQLNRVVCLEICHRCDILDFTNHPEVVYIEYELSVYVNLIRNFSEGVFYQQNMTSFESSLQVNSGCVLHKESYFRFVISRL